MQLIRGGRIAIAHCQTNLFDQGDLKELNAYLNKLAAKDYISPKAAARNIAEAKRMLALDRKVKAAGMHSPIVAAGGKL
jgi:hypothetical protein